MPRLFPHPNFPSPRDETLSAQLEYAEGITLTFTLGKGENVFFPKAAPPVRTDGLWKTTCFELFIKPEGQAGYFEFNFSPSGAWAAYAFDGYRTAMRDLEIAAPQIRRVDSGIAVTVDPSVLPQGRWRVGLSAIIEEQGGAKSYWALAHPQGKPDFHHDDCFALKLPAASGA